MPQVRPKQEAGTHLGVGFDVVGVFGCFPPIFFLLPTTNDFTFLF